MFTTVISAHQLAGIVSEPSTRVIDCRFSLAEPEAGRRAYLAGHLPGAVYAHLDHDLAGPVVAGKTGRHPLPDPDTFAAKLGSWGIGNQSQVVVYDDQSGAIAARAWWMLRWLGHDAVAVLDGGFQAWTGPIATQPTAPAPARLTPRVRPELVADVDQVERARQRSDCALLDARGLERYRGEVEPIDPVAGHIPGARSLPLAVTLEAGRLRAPGELKQRLLSALDRAPPERSIAYCGSGVTACHLILAAEQAGLCGMRLYPGSWSEWISDPRRPIARGDGSLR
jgi:thiosulfate/3-mercaptopyruvate sulfurtransferase